MHLGNGAITTECMVLGYSLTAVGLGCSWWMKRQTEQPSLIKIAALGTFVFAAQMVNVPVGLHSSAHLVGGVLLAHLLGPGVGMQLMAVVLALQAMLLGDGGIASLGVNVINMAIIPALLVAAVEKWNLQNISAMGVTSAIAILLAALMIPGEIAIGRTTAELQGWQGFFQAMMAYHVFAALLEGIATVGLIIVWQKLESRKLRWAPAMALASALLLMFASPIVSSETPDGYEAAANTAMQQLLVETE